MDNQNGNNNNQPEFDIWANQAPSQPQPQVQQVQQQVQQQPIQGQVQQQPNNMYQQNVQAQQNMQTVQDYNTQQYYQQMQQQQMQQQYYQHQPNQVQIDMMNNANQQQQLYTPQGYDQNYNAEEDLSKLRKKRLPLWVKILIGLLIFFILGVTASVISMKTTNKGLSDRLHDTSQEDYAPQEGEDIEGSYDYNENTTYPEADVQPDTSEEDVSDTLEVLPDNRIQPFTSADSDVALYFEVNTSKLPEGYTANRLTDDAIEFYYDDYSGFSVGGRLSVIYRVSDLQVADGSSAVMALQTEKLNDPDCEKCEIRTIAVSEGDETYLLLETYSDHTEISMFQDLGMKEYLEIDITDEDNNVDFSDEGSYTKIISDFTINSLYE